ncbi:MAG: two-component regulator propeller domain-containing protein [Balneolaceae bacterium]
MAIRITFLLSRVRKPLFIAVGLSFLPFLFTYGQNLEPYIEEDQYLFKSWNNTDGLPQNTIFDIIEDTTGYLWVATEEGLVRFDGNDFYIINQKTTDQLQSVYFTDLATAASGGIWASSRNTILKVEDYNISTYDFKDYLDGSIISSVAESGDGGLWAGTRSGKLFLLDRKEITNEDGWGDGTSRAIQHLQNTTDGLLIGTSEGLYKRHGRTGRITVVPGLDTVNVRALTVEKNGAAWIGTENYGFFNLYEGELKQISVEHGLPEPFITSLEPGPDGRVWIGTSSSGLYVYEDGSVKEVDRQEFSRDDIKSIFVSKQNVIWLGTTGSGLAMMKSPDVFRLSDNLEFSDSIILPIYEHTNGDIWLGTAGNGIFRYKDGVVTKYSRSDGLPNEIVLSVFGTEQAIYVATAGGLARFNLQSNHFDKSYTQSDGLASNIVQSVFKDSKDNLWVAARSGGIHTIHEDQVTTIKLPQELDNATFLSFFEDVHGDIWLGSDGAGVIRIESGKKLSFYTILQGLPSNIVHSFYEDMDGDLWLGTAGGLAYFEEEQFHVLESSNGLRFEEVYAIIEDDQNYVWLSSNFGLQRISVDQLNAFKRDKNPDFQISVRTFTSSDGMANSEANGGIFPAGWKMSDGSLWFPTVEGAAIVKPATIDDISNPVNIHINGIKFGNEEHVPDNHITIPSGVHNIEINYTSIEFSRPDAINFSYRLKGVNDEWENVGDRNTAYFTSLYPGTYTFEVIAERYGQSSEAAGLIFDIAPFFYQTWWFRVGMLFMLFMAGYLVKQLHSKSEEENKLKSLVSERTRELEQALNEKNILIMEVHHRVKNNLAIISSFLYLQAFSSSNDELKHVLFDFQSRIKSIATIHEVLYQQENLSELDFKEVLEKMISDISETNVPDKQVSLKVDIDSVKLNVNQAVPAALFTNEVLTNCYKHAFRDRKSGSVYLSLKKKGDLITFQIEDDGIGITEEVKESESLGLKLIQTLVQQLKGDLTTESDKGTSYILKFKRSNIKGSSSNILASAVQN